MVGKWAYERGSVRNIVALGGALALLALAAPALPTSAQEPVAIDVLSNRADLVSGGEALVQVVLPSGTDAAAVRVDVDGRDVTSEFAPRPNGKFEGLVTGLKVGSNLLTATAPGGAGASITITDHPIGGPVFSGPQIQPWTCAAGAVDKQCDRPATFTYEYKNAITGQFDTYDPSNPPPSFAIATTKTDQGVTVPYIVRQETGDEDRDQYAIAVLYDPGKPWAPWAPQKGWNGKMVYNGGASCGFVHGEGTAPSVIVDAALSRGFAVASTALDNNGHNCNLVVQAESIMMAKEHFTNHYGEIRYTIGMGCSGGSIFQQQDENEYPGLLDGLQPMCSFPDDWTTAMDPVDCNLLLNYWNTDPTWTETQQAAVLGDQTVSVCQSWVNVYQYSQGGNPSNTNSTITPCWANSSDQSQEYNASSNPNGVRCTLQDYMVDVLGRRPQSVWTPVEKKIGHGFANSPYDNVGVEYGLRALQAGTITPSMFASLNARVGGFDIDYNPTAARTQGSPYGIAAAYRAGLVNEGDGLTTDPMVDLRGHDTSEIHSDFRSYVMRARLDRIAGGHGNQVIWTGAAPLTGDSQFSTASLVLVDQWLSAVQKDSGAGTLTQKVVRDRPAGAVDACWNGIGGEVPSTQACQAALPYYADPRIAAGEPFTDDVLKCQLKPLSRSDPAFKGITFSAADWASLQAAFPTGVCDYGKAPQYKQGSVKWLSFMGGPGGQPLGAEPVSKPFGVTSSAPAVHLPNTAGGAPVAAVLLVAMGVLGASLLRARRQTG